MENRNAAPSGYPYASTRAAQMLREALISAKLARNLSARQASIQLGYKQPVVLSHMANGRVPIPLERAIDIAAILEIPADSFLLAALEQREPRTQSFMRLGASANSSHDPFLSELHTLAGSDLSSLPSEHKQVLREVVTDRFPKRRWLTLAELPAVEAIRKAVPQFSTCGLPKSELDGIAAFLET